MILKKRNNKIVAKFKLPDSDKIGMQFIKHLIPTLRHKKLIALIGKLQSYPDSKEKTEILEMIKKEFKARNLEWYYD